MTNLSWLYSAIDGRTKGEWGECRSRTPDVCTCGLAWHPSGQFELGRAQTGKDARFVTIMGSCADELKAVILAGQELVDESSFFYGNMRAALAALAKKGPKT